MILMIKNLPSMQETQVQSLGWEDPLKKGMVTHSSVLAWRVPIFLPGKSHGQRSLVGYIPWACRVQRDLVTNTFTFTALQTGEASAMSPTFTLGKDHTQVFLAETPGDSSGRSPWGTSHLSWSDRGGAHSSLTTCEGEGKRKPFPKKSSPFYLPYLHLFTLSRSMVGSWKAEYLHT